MIKGRIPFLSDAEELAPVDARDPLGELPVPTLDERVLFYLRAVHGNRDFTEEERSNARNVLLNSMAAEIAAQLPVVKRHTGRRGLVMHTTAAAQYRQSVQRKEAIRVAPIARRRTSILALTATLGLVLIVTGGTLGYRWTYPHMADEVHASTTGPRAPTHYLSSLDLDSACPGTACGADRITTQRGRCARGFSQAATRAANIVWSGNSQPH